LPFPGWRIEYFSPDRIVNTSGPFFGIWFDWAARPDARTAAMAMARGEFWSRSSLVRIKVLAAVVRSLHQ
jgi:hypothetical protein